MLGTLDPSKKPDWKKHLPSLVYAYNCTKHESTKFSPFQLMFGRTPKLPIDSVFETANEEITKQTTTEYVEELQKRLETSREIVNCFANRSRERQKEHYDKRAEASKINVGDKVLAKILAYEGRNKIADKFEEQPYIVTGQPNSDIPVYEVTSKNGTTKVLHRNKLLLIGITDSDTNKSNKEEKNKKDDSSVKPISKPRKRLSKEAAAERDKVIEITEKEGTGRTETDSESEDSDIEFVSPTNHGRDAYMSEKKDEDVETLEIEESAADETNTVVGETEVLIDDLEIEDASGQTDNIATDVISTEDEETERKRLDKAEGGTDIVVHKPEDGNTDTKQTKKQKQKQKIDLKKPPKPPPRRPQRTLKKPEWMKDYHMNQITCRTLDNRTDALNQLLESGILNTVSTDIANRLWEAVMK
ncbi:uncharacterized protein DDB_G0284459-like [Mercenaria mercenaria]|uniref:uncharacterized protein DDB_G0284459-like n=1 Tax=Mercenaria mercenaria TaxID=6596 RepID=UPI00234F0922|nr:uncharacterized protein DDB_G0284459-like [Mercenaria mercenaria]XP_045169074.2 uncharacterized protein DDB_G0284459-like [Mercenaria mercenaria]